MQIQCHGCGKQLPINDHMLGTKIKCGDCQSVVYVPSFRPDENRGISVSQKTHPSTHSDQELQFPESFPTPRLPSQTVSSNSHQPGRSFPVRTNDHKTTSISNHAIIVTAVCCAIGLLVVIGSATLASLLTKASPPAELELADEELEPEPPRARFREGYSIALPTGFEQQSREETEEGYVVYRFRSDEGYRFTLAIIPDPAVDRFTAPPREYSEALVESVPELSEGIDTELSARRVTVERMRAAVFNYWQKETYRGITFIHYMVAMDDRKKIVLKFEGKYGAYDEHEENIVPPDHWYDSLLTLRHESRPSDGPTTAVPE